MKRKRKLNWKRLGIVAGALLVVIALVVGLLSMAMKGCSKKEEPVQETTTTVQPVTIGEQTSQTTAINLENQTGQAIISFKVKNYKDADYGENLLGSQRIKNKATAVWNFHPEDGVQYDVEITLANYTQFVLKVWPFDEFSGLVTILYKDGTGYLEYKPKGSDNNVNTFQQEEAADEERARQEQEEAEAEAKKKAEEEAAAQAAAEAEQQQAQQTPEEGTVQEEVPEADAGWTEDVYQEEQTVPDDTVYYQDEYGNLFYYDANGEMIYL